MVALALARKYRPSSFDDLVGQEAISQTLSQALDSGRLSHAYLFSGLRGSGKTSTARIFAKALLCEKGPTSKPCQECMHCVMANENRHIDIIEMDAASNRGIDDIKELIEHTKYKPSSGRYKIFIIDEVHMLTTQAFNALLKTLEEPPDFVKFILATTDPLKLPATILSRVQHFRFKKIPQKLVTSHLEHILNLENISYEVEAIEIISRSGAGSLRDSLTLLDQAIVYAHTKIDVATVTTMLGIIEPSVLQDLLDAIVAKDKKRVLEFIKYSSEYEAEMILDELIIHLKDILFGSDSRFTPLVLDRFFRAIASGKELLSLGSDGEFVLSLVLFKMMEALYIKDIDEVIESLQSEVCNKPKIITPIQPVTPNTVSKQIPQKEYSSSATVVPNGVLGFKELVKKLYDRDYDLGECFERTIEFESFANGHLVWKSSAEGKDKKMLINHWSLIRTFVEEIFGVGTKIENRTIKQQNSIVESKSSMPKESVETNSTLIPSSCINPDIGNTEASKEIDPQKELLNEPMVKEAIELLQPKKIRIRKKS